MVSGSDMGPGPRKTSEHGLVLAPCPPIRAAGGTVSLCPPFPRAPCVRRCNRDGERRGRHKKWRSPRQTAVPRPSDRPALLKRGDKKVD